MGTLGRTEYEGYFSGRAISACITRIAAFQWVVLARSALVAHGFTVGPSNRAEGTAWAVLASRGIRCTGGWAKCTGWA